MLNLQPQAEEEEVKEDALVQPHVEEERKDQARIERVDAEEVMDEGLIEQIGGEVRCGCNALALIVDDNDFNLLPLQLVLKSAHNLECIKALDGAAAIELFRRDRSKSCCDIRIKLVFMDLAMPDIDGFEAILRIMDILRNERAIAGTYDTSRDNTEPARMAREMGVAVIAVAD